jgi:hypothetical protein
MHFFPVKQQLGRCPCLHVIYYACNRQTTGIFIKLYFVQNDEEVLDNLNDLVADPPDPEMELLSAQGCTGMHGEAHHQSQSKKLQAHTLLNADPITACAVFGTMVMPCNAFHQMLML